MEGAHLLVVAGPCYQEPGAIFSGAGAGAGADMDMVEHPSTEQSLVHEAAAWWTAHGGERTAKLTVTVCCAVTSAVGRAFQASRQRRPRRPSTTGFSSDRRAGGGGAASWCRMWCRPSVVRVVLALIGDAKLRRLDGCTEGAAADDESAHAARSGSRFAVARWWRRTRCHGAQSCSLPSGSRTGS